MIQLGGFGLPGGLAGVVKNPLEDELIRPIVIKAFQDYINNIGNQSGESEPTDNRLFPGNVLRDGRGYYDHFGIYAGNSTAIHFTDGIIQITSLLNFTENKKGYIDVMGFNEEETRNITLNESCARAHSKIGMSEYDLFNNNCEHFALWCRTGKAYSSQAFGTFSEKYADELTALASAFGVAVSSQLINLNIPRAISAFYSKEVGMKTMRTVDINKVTDAISKG